MATSLQSPPLAVVTPSIPTSALSALVSSMSATKKCAVCRSQAQTGLVCAKCFRLLCSDCGIPGGDGETYCQCLCLGDDVPFDITNLPPAPDEDWLEQDDDVW